jgi:hypothetical protein
MDRHSSTLDVAYVLGRHSEFSKSYGKCGPLHTLAVQCTTEHPLGRPNQQRAHNSDIWLKPLMVGAENNARIVGMNID